MCWHNPVYYATQAITVLPLPQSCRLYETHVDISAGRPISFHHISKSGGTSVCQLARVNGCKGPVMNRAENCLLNKG